MTPQPDTAGLGPRDRLVALALGAIGVLVPVVPVVSGLALWFFPPIGMGVLALWAWETRRQWRQGRVSARRWAAITWFLLVGPLSLLITIIFLPPGAGLPDSDGGVRTISAMLVTAAVGSALLALLSLWAGDRLARPPTR